MTDIRCEHCGAKVCSDPIDGLERLAWRAETGNRWSWLSPRLRDVVVLIGKGFTYPQVAAQLGISQHTVRGYAVEIKTRLESSKTPQKAIIDYYHEYLA